MIVKWWTPKKRPLFGKKTSADKIKNLKIDHLGGPGDGIMIAGLSHDRPKSVSQTRWLEICQDPITRKTIIL